jgi:hypothetical protein
LGLYVSETNTPERRRGDRGRVRASFGGFRNATFSVHEPASVSW